jgi:NTE family protein
LWLQRGPLDAAIRASIAIPGVVEPHILDGRMLADGGILDPMPVSPLAGINADLTIAVSLSGEDRETHRVPPIDAEPRAEWLNRLLRSTSAWRETNAARSVLGRFGTTTELEDAADDDLAAAEEVSEDVATDSAMVPKFGGLEVVNRAVDVMQAALARHQLAAYPPDIVIEVPRTSIRSLDFHHAAAAIDVGRVLAARALDSYESAKDADGET